MELKTYRRKSNQVQVQAFEFDSLDIPESEQKAIKVEAVIQDGGGVRYDCSTEHPNRTVYFDAFGTILVKRASGYLYPYTKEQFNSEYEEVLEKVEDV